MRVLITGVAGYIGSVVARTLLEGNLSVVGIDNLLFGGEGLTTIFTHPLFVFRRADLNDTALIRSLFETSQFDAVVHLAAIVGDPACRSQPDLAEAVNWTATVKLAAVASEHLVERFVFASTCSNYGASRGAETLMAEDAELRPVSHYATLKVRAEQHLLQRHLWPKDTFPVVLRFATAHGVSPRMRFDLTVNEFAAATAEGYPLDVYNPLSWRPYCHVADISRAIEKILFAPTSQVAFETFNVGDTTENYRKDAIVAAVVQRNSSATVRHLEGAADPRDYRVDFSKIARCLDFRCSRRVNDTIDQVSSMIEAGIFVDTKSWRYRNA